MQILCIKNKKSDGSESKFFIFLDGYNYKIEDFFSDFRDAITYSYMNKILKNKDINNVEITYDQFIDIEEIKKYLINLGYDIVDNITEFTIWDEYTINKNTGKITTDERFVNEIDHHIEIACKQAIHELELEKELSVENIKDIMENSFFVLTMCNNFKCRLKEKCKYWHNWIKPPEALVNIRLVNPEEHNFDGNKCGMFCEL